jgi:hypothetical protein
VRHENLSVGSSSGLAGRVTWKVWWVFPSGGVVRAVRYTLEVWGELCHSSVHAAIAAILDASLWLFIVCCSLISRGRVGTCMLDTCYHNKLLYVKDRVVSVKG